MLQFGEEDSELDSEVGSREAKTNRASHAGHHRQRHGKALHILNNGMQVSP